MVRLSRWPTPELLVIGDKAYDPAVMYIASASFLEGLLPYRDFTFLHPPGALFGFAPSVLFGAAFGDAVGMASARLAVVLLGVVNTGLVVLLLRRYGFLAVLVGGGLYAGWSPMAYTEQRPLLEPFLATALLVALHLLRSKHRWAPLWIGAILGVATMVKLWAAVDLIAFAVLLLKLRRFADLWRFILGAFLGGSAVALPFFLAAPGPMWEMVVTAQLGRPDQGVGLLTRATMFGPVPGFSHSVYRAGMGLLMAALLGVALLLVIRGWRGRAESAEAVEAGAWASIAILHAVIMSLSSSFYDHYAMFVAVPLTLVVGAAVGWVNGRVHLERRAFTALAIAAVLLVASVTVAASLYKAVRTDTDRMSAAERVRIAEWADGLGCTWASVTDRVLIDEVVDALRSGCTMSVDPFGDGLLAHARGGDRRAAAIAAEERHLAQADGLVLPIDETQWPFTARTGYEIRTDFVAGEVVGTRVLWERSGNAG